MCKVIHISPPGHAGKWWPALLRADGGGASSWLCWMANSKSYTSAASVQTGARMAGARMSPTAAQTPPKASSRDLYDDFLPYLITRLAHELDSDLIETLRGQRINVARWRILAVLAMGDGITIGEIAARAMLRQSALSRVLMKMEAEQFVRRLAKRDDARFVEVFLTDQGRALFELLDPVVRRRENRLLDGFSRDEADAAFEVMRRLIGNMEA